MKKIIIKGKSGQGIQRVGFMLANILKDKGYQVALTSEYGALVRAGSSTIRIVFSKEKINNPLVEKADFEYDLSDPETEQFILKKNPNPRSLNMVLLGIILHQLNLGVTPKEILPYLPAKFQTENLEAIKKGQEL